MRSSSSGSKSCRGNAIKITDSIVRSSSWELAIRDGVFVERQDESREAGTATCL